MGEIPLRPLEGRIETMTEYEGSGEPLAYWTKGHVDKDEFALETRRYCKELPLEIRDRMPYGKEDVHHVWYRNVPVGRDRPGETLMRPCTGPGRGAYPVTKIDVWQAIQRRK